MGEMEERSAHYEAVVRSPGIMDCFTDESHDLPMHEMLPF
jgi:hypothetical protein